MSDKQPVQKSRFRIEQRTAEPLLAARRPYEEFCLASVNVIRIGHRWHMWYESYDRYYRNDADAYLCYAHSANGVDWIQPNLKLVAYHEDRKNNILLAGPEIGGLSGHTVFLDEAAPPEERFKMVFIRLGNPQEWWIYGGVSADGLSWKLGAQPLLAKNSDTQLACFRDGNLYRLYVRMWSAGLYRGQRLVGYSESHSFGAFPDPVPILAPDEADPPHRHFYNSAATKLKDGLYVMFSSAYDSVTGLVVPHLAVSADGRAFERVGREGFMGLGTGFDNKSIYVAPGAVPGDRPGTWWFYYLGLAAGHDDKFDSQVQYLGGIGRFLLVVEE